MRPGPVTAVVLVLAWPLHALRADDHRTPLAGEPVTATLFGFDVSAPERDRRNITYLNAGGAFLGRAPEEKGFSPQGGLYFWRVSEGTSRLRAIVAGIVNEVRWDHAASTGSPFSLVLALDSLTLPWARSEYRQGVRMAAGEMEAHEARVGVGLAWRRGLTPFVLGACDNMVDVALTVEPGALWFRRGSDTAATALLPSDTFEGRLHFRLRADALERNIVELPHRGWAAGADVTSGWRSRWERWGLPEEGLARGGKSWLAASAYAWAAFRPFPALSERHRMIASAHVGIGSDLDRFSAFRLGNGSSWGDYETLSKAVLPAAGVDEIFTSRYAVADLEYRLELLYFLYLQLRGTLAWADRPVAAAGGTATRTGSFPAVTAGITTGLPWNLSLEAALSYNFGLERTREGRVEKGSTGFLFSLTKEF